jgi:aminopeptidase N
MRFAVLLVFFNCLSLFLVAQNPGVDVIHYDFTIEVSDYSDEIQGTAKIDWMITQKQKTYSFDLKTPKNDKGMHLSQVSIDGQKIPYTHENGKVTFELKSMADTIHTTFVFSGIPEDGLIISKNKHGNRTFFSDHWPDRGSHYLPLNDHPSDKATSRFTVLTPSHYTVVSNGLLESEKVLENGQKETIWNNQIEIPVKVMVIGIADFSIQTYGEKNGIKVSGYVFPEDSANGHFEYSRSVDILDFYNGIFGPYPFKKLANVQSKTIFGGMENAGCIFYHENSKRGDGGSEALLAHEIVHQWFGNSASETDWKHLWLSEGFATYFTGYYLQQRYGDERFYSYLESNAKKVFRFKEMRPNAVIVPDIVNDAMNLLNPYSYEKGGWFLHMLRIEMGDDLFMSAVREYYNTYHLSNASSNDFKEICQKYSEKDLSPLFNYWLHSNQLPTLHVEYKLEPNSSKIVLWLENVPENFYMSNLDVQIKVNYEILAYNVRLSGSKTSKIEIPVTLSEKDIVINSNWNYLFMVD